MLESLLSFNELSEKPYLMFLWSLVMASIGIILSLQVSYEITVGTSTFNLGGIFGLIFTIIPSVYFITVLIKKEERLEEKDFQSGKKTSMWQRHERDVAIMLFFFAGITVAFALWSMVLPDTFFEIQDQKIQDVRQLSGAVTGDAINEMNQFNRILTNNLQVMIFSFIFSFLFGAGAVFIIAWNASILGVFIGQLSKHMWDVPVVGLAFLPHGIPEIGGYIAAALSGGLISAAIIRKSESRVLKLVVFDAV
ncbi:MAG: stage II sporulation protein M, partial [Candidatus Aenigmatarchaeota archaeon]